MTEIKCFRQKLNFDWHNNKTSRVNGSPDPGNELLDTTYMLIDLI